MLLLKVTRRNQQYLSKDSDFRISFFALLSNPPPVIRLFREGYIRALEICGREGILLDYLKSSVVNLNEWRKQNPKDLDLYRKYANSYGYDWKRGSVTPEGLYTYDPSNPFTLEGCLELLLDISQFIHVDNIEEPAGEKLYQQILTEKLPR
jgi:hypothetical protein